MAIQPEVHLDAVLEQLAVLRLALVLGFPRFSRTRTRRRTKNYESCHWRAQAGPGEISKTDRNLLRILLFQL
jgi:hypothetical protein